jgi:hypothetical protein
MPASEALQVFYGTIPLIGILPGIWLHVHFAARTEQMLLKDILTRMGRLETGQDDIRKETGQVKERLVKLETRAGIVFSGE